MLTIKLLPALKTDKCEDFICDFYELKRKTNALVDTNNTNKVDGRKNIIFIEHIQHADKFIIFLMITFTNSKFSTTIEKKTGPHEHDQHLFVI